MCFIGLQHCIEFGCTNTINTREFTNTTKDKYISQYEWNPIRLTLPHPIWRSTAKHRPRFDVLYHFFSSYLWMCVCGFNIYSQSITHIRKSSRLSCLNKTSAIHTSQKNLVCRREQNGMTARMDLEQSDEEEHNCFRLMVVSVQTDDGNRPETHTGQSWAWIFDCVWKSGVWEWVASVSYDLRSALLECIDK